MGVQIKSYDGDVSIESDVGGTVFIGNEVLSSASKITLNASTVEIPVDIQIGGRSGLTEWVYTSDKVLKFMSGILYEVSNR